MLGAAMHSVRSVRRALHAACRRRASRAHVPGTGVRSMCVAAPPERDARFAAVTDTDVQALRDVMAGAQGGTVVTDPDDLQAYNKDWMGKWAGHSSVAVRPRSTEEVSQVLKYCNDNMLAVVPQGGNTGLVGGSVPVHDEVVLSMSSMNKILSFDEGSGVLVCEAGCILQALDGYLRDHDHIMPLDLGAKGTCQIGGNASTNAGGLRYLRYGSLHGSILGLEVVKADGTVLNMLNTLRKDNVGPDLKQLFIGSEGTLGVITKVAIQTPRKPSSVQLAFFGCESFDDVRTIWSMAKQQLGEVLSAFEFADAGSLGFSMSYLKLDHPLGDAPPFNVLIETSGSNGEHDQEKLHAFLESVMESGVISDGIVAQDDTQAGNLWSLREQIAVGLSSSGMVYKYDLSLPLAHMYELVEVTQELLKKECAGSVDAQVVGYGHIGDCNLHLNISTPHGSDSILHHLEPFLFEWTASRGGSISAEHGVGQCKRDFVHLQRSPAVVQELRALKHVFDPKGILNPYKVVA